jgi:hypothetical protein
MSGGRGKRNSNFSVSMKLGIMHRKDGKVAIVTGGNGKVFAKTNHCCETPAIGNLHSLRKNSYVKSAKSRPQSVVSCDPPCQNLIERQSEESILGAMNRNSADENVDFLY